MARASRSIGTGKAAKAAAEKAKADLARAAEEKLANMTFGEKIADGLKAVAENLRKAGSGNATIVADALEALAKDEVLEIADQGAGTMDYMIGVLNETLPMHLRSLGVSEARKVRDRVASGQSGTDHNITYG